MEFLYEREESKRNSADPIHGKIFFKLGDPRYIFCHAYIPPVSYVGTCCPTEGEWLSLLIFMFERKSKVPVSALGDS